MNHRWCTRKNATASDTATQRARMMDPACRLKLGPPGRHAHGRAPQEKTDRLVHGAPRRARRFLTARTASQEHEHCRQHHRPVRVPFEALQRVTTNQ